MKARLPYQSICFGGGKNKRNERSQSRNESRARINLYYLDTFPRFRGPPKSYPTFFVYPGFSGLQVPCTFPPILEGRSKKEYLSGPQLRGRF